ncbi:MAG: hypothetical protein HQ511_09145 [Rhodospirillales bacterium]|nr:hypothetical protein [Rhodospirillales bacterium]
MDWTVISAVAEMTAAFGVVGSLIFVGFQVRQNSAGLRYTAVQAQMTAAQDLAGDLASSQEITEIWQQGMQDPENMEDTSRMRFIILGSRMLRTLQSIHWLWLRGVLDDGMFRSQTALMEDFSAHTGWRYAWKVRRHHYDSDFQQFVDKMFEEDGGKVLYGEAIAGVTG